MVAIFHTCYAPPQHYKKDPKHVYHEVQSISLQHQSIREGYHPFDDHLYEFKIKELNILSVEIMTEMNDKWHWLWYWLLRGLRHRLCDHTTHT